MVVHEVFARHRLRVFDVEQLPTHGGSLRVHACHAGDRHRPRHARVAAVLQQETAAGLGDLATYDRFAAGVAALKCDVLDFLVTARRAGKTVAGYGAPAKGNTLLNYCGIGPELLAFTVDRSPHKQGRFLPGSRIPVVAPERLRAVHPDYVFILPWNLQDEVVEQMHDVREWGGRFVVPIPRVRVV
jgi:hypothetical protein